MTGVFKGLFALCGKGELSCGDGVALLCGQFGDMRFLRFEASVKLRKYQCTHEVSLRGGKFYEVRYLMSRPYAQ